MDYVKAITYYVHYFILYIYYIIFPQLQQRPFILAKFRNPALFIFNISVNSYILFFHGKGILFVSTFYINFLFCFNFFYILIDYIQWYTGA